LDVHFQEEMRKEIEPFLPHIMFFIDKYVVGGRNVVPPPAAYANAGGGGSQKSYGGRPPPPPQMWPGQVEAIMDIEENIWSPRLGIKGKVDLTVQVKMQHKDKKVLERSQCD
jgi:DNA replication ATP-dependent helicase Dna2